MMTRDFSQKFLVLLPFLVLILCEASRTQEGTTRECSVDKDCQTIINGSICTDRNCTCPELTQVVVTIDHNSSYCLPGVNVTGGNCTFNKQCNYDNGKCTEEGVCGCVPRYTETEDGSCTLYARSAIIPIAVGIAIGVAVFGTMCLYLWLSRTKEEVDAN